MGSLQVSSLVYTGGVYKTALVSRREENHMRTLAQQRRRGNPGFHSKHCSSFLWRSAAVEGILHTARTKNHTKLRN